MATLSPGDIVRVTNLGSKPVTIAWNSKPYKLEPGKIQFVPVEAAVLWFGDPRSTDSIQSWKDESGGVTVVPSREDEIRRLTIKYGFNMTTGVPENTFLKNEDGEYPVPRIELATLDGDVIQTVLSDPEGESVNVATPTIAEQSDLMRLVESQQRQLNFLLEQLGMSKQVVETSEVPEDQSHTQGNDVPGRPPSAADLLALKEDTPTPTGPSVQSGPDLPPDFFSGSSPNQ